MQLFTDGSVNNTSQVGIGAYLFVSELDKPLAVLEEEIQFCRFEATSSTKLELQTLLGALAKVDSSVSLTVYTDSQNILSLLKRRKRLEANGFSSKKRPQLLHAELYRSFYKAIDKLDCTFVQLKGHTKASEKTRLDKIFTLVDRAARNAIRKERS